MLFNSLEFLVFLPIVFVVYWQVLGKRLKLQNLFIVIASYIFYGWWDWRFLFLIAFTTGCSYVGGILIKQEIDKGRHCVAKALSVGNILLNLGILGVFKYYNFFAESIQALFAGLGCHLDYPTLYIILPVGISFYTFQALSYTIDIQRGGVK